MKTVRESTTLYNFLGSHNPYWRLTESSDVLRFSTTEITEPDRILQLSAEQAARIREMTVITSSLMMSLTVDESDLSVHLVGRKINKREWEATRLHGMTHRRLLVIYHMGFPLLSR